MVTGIGDDQVAVMTEPVDEQVVDHPGVLVQQRVLGSSDLDLRHVIADQPLQKGERARPFHPDLAHVGDVEDPCVGAHGDVFFPDPVVLDRHLPAGERHHFRAGFDMGFVEAGPCVPVSDEVTGSAYAKAGTGEAPELMQFLPGPRSRGVGR